MKKWLGVIAGIGGMVIVFIGLILHEKFYTENAVIGGADGPTAVFIAGRMNEAVFMIPIGIGILCIAFAIFLLYKRKH